MSLAGEEGVPPLLSDDEEREERSAPPHADPDAGPLGPVHDATDDEPRPDEGEAETLVPPVSPPPLPPEEDPEE